MLAALTALSLVVATVEPPKLSEAAEKDLKAFEGKWKMVAVVENGNEETPMADGADVIIEFKGRKTLMDGKDYMEIVALDPSTDPKVLDFKGLRDQGGVKKDQVFEAIYKLDGDTLTLAIYFGEVKKRPEKFASAAFSEIAVVTLKREKK